MIKKRKQLEKSYQELQIREQALHLTVVYENQFVEKIGKKQLENMRDTLLDRINELKHEITQLEKALNIKK